MSVGVGPHDPAADHRMGPDPKYLAQIEGLNKGTSLTERRVHIPPKAERGAADVRRAVNLHLAGESLPTAGEAMDVDASTVQRALKRAGIKGRSRPGCPN